MHSGLRSRFVFWLAEFFKFYPSASSLRTIHQRVVRGKTFKKTFLFTFDLLFNFFIDFTLCELPDQLWFGLSSGSQLFACQQSDLLLIFGVTVEIQFVWNLACLLFCLEVLSWNTHFRWPLWVQTTQVQSEPFYHRSTTVDSENFRHKVASSPALRWCYDS